VEKVLNSRLIKRQRELEAEKLPSRSECSPEGSSVDPFEFLGNEGSLIKGGPYSDEEALFADPLGEFLSHKPFEEQPPLF